MSTQNSTKKDDPQIHLAGARYCEKIREFRINDENEPSQMELQVLTSGTKFFSHFIKYLPECANDVLKMCQFYTKLMKNDFVPLDIADINRLIGICTTMMIRRKEEDVIRNTCSTLKGILNLIPIEVLNKIVLKYSKTLAYIFQKIYLVQTYYTQLTILEIFVYITNDLRNLRENCITTNQLMKKANKNILDYIFATLDRIDFFDFANSSRKFLKYFNNSLFPKTCILSSEGRIITINHNIVKQSRNMIICFNGRNLTVSFFIPHEEIFLNNTFLKNHEKPLNGQSELTFVELECATIEAEKRVYKDQNFIDIQIMTLEARVYNDQRIDECLDEIHEISIRLIDEENTMDKFMETFYEKYKSNEKMLNDNASLVDRESIMTFQTSKSMLNELNDMMEFNTQSYANNTMTQKLETQDAIEIQPVNIKNENKKKASTKKSEKAVEKESDLNLSTRPKRQRKQVNYADEIYNEDNMLEREEPVLSYRQFKTQQRKKPSPGAKKMANKRNISSNLDISEDYELQPVEIITRTTTRKQKTTKLQPTRKRKLNHFETDDENQKENIEKRSNEKIQKKEVTTRENTKKVKPKVPPQEPNSYKAAHDVKNERNQKKLEPIPSVIDDILTFSDSEIRIMNDVTQKIQDNFNKAAESSLEKNDSLPEAEFLTKMNTPSTSAVDEKKSLRNNFNLLIKNIIPGPTTSRNVVKIESTDYKSNHADNLKQNQGTRQISKIPVLKKFKVQKEENSPEKPSKINVKHENTHAKPKISTKNVDFDALLPNNLKDERHALKNDRNKEMPNNRQNEKEESTTELKCFQTDKIPFHAKQFNNPELVKKRKLEDEITFANNKRSKVEEWLQNNSNSFENSDKASNYQSSSIIPEGNKKAAVVENCSQSDDESNISDGIYANDDHQHYSSSSQEKSVDFDARKSLECKKAVVVIEKLEFSQFDSQNNLFPDPCKIFDQRAKDIADKLELRKLKIDDNEKIIHTKYNRSIKHYGRKCLDQMQRTKKQVNYLKDLHSKFEAGKAKLNLELKEHERLTSKLNNESEKRCEELEQHKKYKIKELRYLKKEALRKNEELLQDVWRDYVDGIQRNFNESIRKAYEI